MIARGLMVMFGISFLLLSKKSLAVIYFDSCFDSNFDKGQHISSLNMMRKGAKIM